jgi:hypothetical protein
MTVVKASDRLEVRDALALSFALGITFFCLSPAHDRENYFVTCRDGTEEQTVVQHRLVDSTEILSCFARR